MKKEIFISALVGLGLGVLVTASFFIIKNQSNGAKDMSFIALQQIKELSSDYLAKVENFGLALEDFQNAYEQVLQNIPPEQLAVAQKNESTFKAEILETMINQYVVVATAIEEGFLENQENLKKFKTVVQQALFQLYMSENVPQDNTLSVSQPQIDQAYAQYGAELRARGMNAQQSKEFLVTQITQQNRQRWMMDFITKLKESYRIERNKNLLQQENIGTTGMSMPMES